MKKLTKHRKIILDDLAERRDHPTAKMVFDSVRLHNNKISFATVYNSLEYLVTEGLVKKLNIESESVRYDGVLESHIHLICKKCGTVFDFPNIDLSNTIDTSKIQFSTEEITVTVKGLCNNCKN